MGAFEREQARHRAESLVEGCRKDAGQNAPAFLGPRSGAALGAFYENSNKLQSTIEQQRHYRDWVAAVIRVIANRLAGQEVFMATETQTVVNQRSLNTIKSHRRRPAKHTLPRTLRTKSQTLELIEQHPLLDAINNPNPIMVRWTLIYLLIAHLELTGKAYWWFTPDDNGKLQIWPITPSWVTPLHENGGFFTSYSIQPPGAAGEPSKIPGEQIAFFHYPDPNDLFGAMGTLQTQARAVSSDESIQLAQAVGFKNSIYPGLAIIVGDALDTTGTAKRPLLDRDQRQDILAPIKDQYRGVLKYGEPMILDALIRDVKQISMKPAEMDFLNSGKQTKERIFQGFSVNEIIAGAVENANKASATVADEHFCNAINPKAELISQVMTKVLGPALAKDGQRIHIWIDPCRPNDSDGRRDDYKLGWNMGAVTVNEYRVNVLNLPALETGGDLVYVPATMTSVPVVQVSASSKSSDLKRRGVMTKKQYAGVWLKLHESGEKDFVRDLQALFQSEADQIEAALRERLDSGDKAMIGLRASLTKSSDQGSTLASSVFRPHDWTEKLQNIARKHLLKAAAVGASLEISAVQKLGEFATKADEADEFNELSIDVPKEVLAEIKSQLDVVMGQPYWSGIHQTVLDDLSVMLQASIVNGDSMKKIIGDVHDLLGTVGSKARSENIARTELTGAMNSGHYAARSELIDQGYVTGSEWIATEDYKTRPTHSTADGQTVKKGQKFEVGGEHCPYPGWHGLSASERCRCRCTTVAAGTFADDDDRDAGDGELVAA